MRSVNTHRSQIVEASVRPNPGAPRGRYKRHVPAHLDKRLRGYRTLPLTWSSSMAYVVGLIATDGCLSRDRRHIVLTSRDRELIETYLTVLGRPLRYRSERRRKKLVFYAQFSDVALYDWLVSIGLNAAKSFTLGAIHMPDEFVADLARGLLDGDGSVSVMRHRPTKRKYPLYEYERLSTIFLSASQSHITWLQQRLHSAYGIRGRVNQIKRKRRHDLFRLKYGKHESQILLPNLYADPMAPRLERKAKIWADFLARNCAEGGI
jgi:hypothetical protein